MNRLLLEATLCSVPVFCIWPLQKRPLNVRQTLCIKRILWLASAVNIVRYFIVFEQLQLVLIHVMLSICIHVLFPQCKRDCLILS